MDDSGLTYSLEAMLGILLIAGVVVFVTGNPPPIAEPSGKYSKIQLVNLGEDILSLIASTPYGDTVGDKAFLYSNVFRNYTLVADKTHVAKNENVSFKIYYPSSGSLVNEILYYWGNGNTSSGMFNLSFPTEGGYQVQVRNATNTNFSNNVTIYVGYYLLLLNANGIGVNVTIRGIVTKDGVGVPNLTINIYQDSTLKNNTNLNQEGGRFSLKWAWGPGQFYINASDGTNSSNRVELDVTGNSTVLSIDKNRVFETRNVTLNLTSGANKCLNFSANDNILDSFKIVCTDIGNGTYNLTFNRGGSYIIQYKEGSENSNPVLVNVHIMESYLASPLSYFFGTGDLKFDDLKNLTGPFIHENMDYNLYIYNMSSMDPEEKIFNGIPSHDAVVISRLVRTEAVDGTGVLRELRIVLWYR